MSCGSLEEWAATAVLAVSAGIASSVAFRVWVGDQATIDRIERRFGAVYSEPTTWRACRSTGAVAMFLWTVVVAMVAGFACVDRAARPVMVSIVGISLFALVSTFAFGWPGFLVPPRFRNAKANGSR